MPYIYSRYKNNTYKWINENKNLIVSFSFFVLYGYNFAFISLKAITFEL